MTALLEVEDLTVAYGEVVAVREVSLHLDADELVAVLGANGAGKSTLLGAIIGWLLPLAGHIRLDGEEVGGLETWRRIRRGLALVPEGARVFGDLTVEENLRLARPSEDGLALALDIFPRLDERLDQVAATLSGGERQMLALARAIVRRPKVLLVDEASMGLMPILVDRVFEALQRLREEGIPVLLVEQSTKALRIADRAYVMETGRIVRRGTARELAADPAVERAYLGG